MFQSKLDFFFPFLVFFYGILVVFVLENNFFKKVGQLKMQSIYSQLAAHKPLAWTCFWVGGIWSLQNLLFS